MPHKSYSSLVVKRARAEAAVLKRANRYYERAVQLEKAGKPMQARVAATKGRQLVQHVGRTALEGPVGKLNNPTIPSLRAELAEIDAIIAELETDPFYFETPGRKAYARKWLAYHRRQRLEVQRLLRKMTRRDNGIVEAAAGLQALEYIGAKAKRGSLGRKPKYNPRAKPSLTAIQQIAVDALLRIKPKGRQGSGARQAMQRKAVLKRYAKAAQSLGYTSTQIETQWKDIKDIVLLEQRTENPRAKGSRDPFGVWHAENPGKTSAQRRAIIKALRHHTSKHLRDVARLNDDPDIKEIARAILEKRTKRSPGGVKHNNPKQKNQAKRQIDELQWVKNPSVSDVSRMFQGKASGEVSQYKAANSAPLDLARIGKFVFLQVQGQRGTLRIPGAMVAADTKGRLWIVGKKTPLLSQRAKSGEMLDYGEVTRICYDTAKAHIGNGKRYEYVHAFGEEGGKRPRLLVDSEGMPILRGGDYKIEARGIVN